MPGPQQPAIKLNDAVEAYGDILASKQPACIAPYKQWLEHLNFYIRTAARAGTLSIWHDMPVQISNTF